MQFKRPYATDWVKINDNVEYSKELNLYWHNKRVYDELSATHNGLIGLGAQLKKAITV